MEKITRNDITRIVITGVYGDTIQTYTGYIFSDARIISAEDATDDDWKLLEEYNGYLSICESEDSALEACYVHPDDVHFECVANDALYSGWGYHNPWAGDGLDDLGRNPEYVIEGEADICYLS